MDQNAIAAEGQKRARAEPRPEGVRDNMTRSQMDLHVRSLVCAQFGTTGKDRHGMS